MMWPFERQQAVRMRRDPTIRNASIENPSTPLSSLGAWEDTGRVFAGQDVSETSAMRSAVVFRCVSLKAGTVAGLPLEIYERTDRGRRRAVEHPLYGLLHDQPNDLMSGFTWKEMIETHLMLSGNHYSILEIDHGGRVLAILPVQPSQVDVRRIGGRNRYVIRFPDGSETLDQDEIVHVPGIGFDGLKGLSPIAWAGRQPVGIALALDEFVGQVHLNSVRPSGLMEVAPGMSADGLRRLKAELDGLYAGTARAGRTLLVDPGARWHPMQMTLEDAQTLANRRYQAADIARLFGIPLHMIGETEKSTSWGTGIEQMTIGYQKFSVDPDLSRIEGEMNRKLLKPPFYCEFNREAMNAMDARTQAELYASGIQNAGYTPNEVRRMRNLPDHPDGDDLMIQSGTVPLRSLKQAKGEDRADELAR